jgi:CBS domain-containing protein
VARRAGRLSLFFHRVRDFVTRPPVICDPGVSAVEVARLLSREGIGSVLVTGKDGAPAGIVTDRDLRRKVVAGNRDAAATRAAEIMSAPLITIPATAFAFEAILEMTRREIHHLAVSEEERVVGVVSSHDFLWLQAAHPVTLAREIGQAASFEALAKPAERVTGLLRRLLEEGGTAYDIAQIVAELNDRIVTRVLGLVTAGLEVAGEAAPPVPYCWLAFGSEARREQTLRTDQDNGLVYADPPAELAPRAAAYYARLAAETIRALVSLGFPACEGDFMASNPRWCQPASAWAGYFRRWMEEPTPEQVLAACIFFDVRPIAGVMELGAALRTLLQEEAPSQRVFLRLLARDVADRRVPLTLFRNVAVRRRGPRRGRVDIKMAGSLQLVGAARLHSLALGLGETNTVDRFRAAAARGVYHDDEVREVTDAYQHLMRLRLVHQLEQAADSEPMDNDVDPKRLTRADRLLLRDALKVVTRVQAGIRERFATALVAG